MSGSAALSAARKRRASSQGNGGGGVATNPMAQSASYYGGSKQTLQGIMNQAPPSYQVPGVIPVPQIPAYAVPKEQIPNVPINIYENIELIKKQLSDRTILIQTQGSNIPPDKLRVLQKQNEIQTQVLRQKMMIAQQMEAVEQQKQLELQQQYQAEKQNLSKMASPNEPEFIYEKGIPRRNPRYKKPEEVKPLVSAPQIQTQFTANAILPQTYPQSQRTINVPLENTSSKKALSPFVSMISDTGVIPPPIVILKSHDATLSEHHYMLQDIVSQLEDLHNKCDDLYSRHEQDTSERTADLKPSHNTESHPTHNNENTKDGQEPQDQNQEQDQEDQENVLLMEEVINDLTNSREFIEGVVDKIVNETNLSEVIMKIDPIIKENQELRSLIFSQQQMMNEMNMLLFRLLNEQQLMKQQQVQPANVEHTNPISVEKANADKETPNVCDNTADQPTNDIPIHDDGMNNDGLYPTEMTEVILSDPSNMVEDPDDKSQFHVDDQAEEHAEEEEQEEAQEEQEQEEQEEEYEEEQDQDQDDEPEFRCITPRDDDYQDIRSDPVSLIVSEILENAY